MKSTCFRILCGVLLAMLTGCGSSSTSDGNGAKQYTLDAQANITITSPAPTTSLGKGTTGPQVMIGTVLVEVTNDTADQIGIKVLNFELTPEVSMEPEFVITLNPEAENPIGIIFKLCDITGVPKGTSYIDLDLVVSTADAVDFDGTLIKNEYLPIGGLTVSADPGDRTKLPYLGNIPTIGYLFKGSNDEAKIDDLLIILTPEIIQDTM